MSEQSRVSWRVQGTGRGEGKPWKGWCGELVRRPWAKKDSLRTSSKINPGSNKWLEKKSSFFFSFFKINRMGFCLLLEKAMAPYSSTLAWKIPWKEEPGRLQSMGSLRVRYDWATSLALFTLMHWRRKWQPTPVFLPGESQGQGILVGCRLWGHRESDMTAVTQHGAHFVYCSRL